MKEDSYYRSVFQERQYHKEERSAIFSSLSLFASLSLLVDPLSSPL
jgi:hypothetical protein